MIPVTRPLVGDFRADDGEISTYLDSIKNNKLNFRSKKFFCRTLNRDLCFDDVVNALRKRVVPRDYILAMSDVFNSVPIEMDLIKDELVWQIKRIVALLEDTNTSLKQFVIYADYLEGEVDRLKKELAVKEVVVVKESIKEDVVIQEPVVLKESLKEEADVFKKPRVAAVKRKYT